MDVSDVTVSFHFLATRESPRPRLTEVDVRDGNVEFDVVVKSSKSSTIGPGPPSPQPYVIVQGSIILVKLLQMFVILNVVSWIESAQINSLFIRLHNDLIIQDVLIIIFCSVKV